MWLPTYRHVSRDPLNIPIIALDGRYDNTIDRGNMRQWRHYTTGRFCIIGIPGDHYFVTKLYRQVLLSDYQKLFCCVR